MLFRLFKTSDKERKEEKIVNIETLEDLKEIIKENHYDDVVISLNKNNDELDGQIEIYDCSREDTIF